MKIIQMLRGTFAKKPELADGQMYLAKDTKQVFIGDKAITEGEIELVENSRFDALKSSEQAAEQQLAKVNQTVNSLSSQMVNLTTEVNDQASDIADIQADYAQTTGGNTVTANGVVISDENGKLKSTTGTEGQIVKFDANGKPVVEDAGYLPLTGGTMSGNIKTSKQFSIANSNNDGHVNLGSIISITRKNLFDKTKTNTIQVSSSLVEAYVPGDNGVRAALGAGIATLKNYSDNSAFVATKDADIATKKYVDDKAAEYLPLSGGEMTGDIEVSAQTTGFQISKSTETLDFNMGVNIRSAGLWSTMNGQEANASISVSQTDQSDATIQLIQQLNTNEGVNIILSDSEAKIYNLSDSGPEETYVPTSKDSLVNKDYVDGSITSIPITDITVSATQPTNQKAGDFWYRVTGTI